MTYWDLLGWGFAIFIVAIFAILLVAVSVSLVKSPKRPGRRKLDTYKGEESDMLGYGHGFVDGKHGKSQARSRGEYARGYRDGEAARLIDQKGEGND